MRSKETALPGVYILEPITHGDARGWFIESYNAQMLSELGICETFVQDNHSFSAQQGTLRGLHCQKAPHAQAKLVRCTRGALLDVAVDIRRNSPTYCMWVSVELSEQNKLQLFIPSGFAHGFITLTPEVEVQYKASDYYAPSYDRSIRFDDPAIGVEWGYDAPVLSDKDRLAPLLKDSDVDFIYLEAMN